MTLQLVVFDVDGTLVDSQAEILGAMHTAFAQEGLEAPERDAIMGIVGLSLPEAMARLAPQRSRAVQSALVDAYKSAYNAARKAGAGGPLYPGMRGLVERLSQRDTLLMGIATGKSRRGLNGMIAHHDLGGYFVTQQVADDHPSKPHPSMLWTALADAGAEATSAVMIGDTSYDMDMGAAAGMATIGVTWGYHPRTALSGATHVVDHADALENAIDLALGGFR